MGVYKKMIFSIETSTSSLSLTLTINNQVINTVSIQIKNELSEIIIPTIKRFLKINLITFKSISYLVIGCGPGSFTGTRALISAAKGIYLSNKHMKILGINSLAGLAMSALNEAKTKNLQYIIASIDTKRDDQFLQLFELNNSDEKLLPFFAINNIQAIKLENLNDFLKKNKLGADDFLFVGFVPTLLKNKLLNINFSEQLTQIPDAFWVSKLTSHIFDNKVNYEKSKIAFNELKPIYVRSAMIN